MSNTKSFLSSLKYLNSHPEFQKQPMKVIVRIGIWEIFKLLKYRPTINIHQTSKMRLKPGKRRGTNGLVYVFRDGKEPIVRYAIDKYALPRTICYDIGANMGLWTLKMSEVVGNEGHVYAFEPVSKNIEMLRENIALSQKKNVEVVMTGLGTQSGNVTIYIPDGYMGRCSLAPESDRDQTENIIIQRLDDIWEAQGCPQVSLVKMDVEGSEPIIIRGGTKFFNQVKPVIISEICGWKLKAMGKDKDDIWLPLQSWGYEGWVWDPTTHDVVKANGLVDCDVLFIPKS